MKAESIVFAAAGVFFGLIVGWIIGTQQAGPPRPAGSAPSAAQTTAPSSTGQSPAPKPVDENRAQTLRATALQDPRNAVVRVELGNMYMDADRPTDAVTWYEEALRITPRDVNVSTDLGVCYHYMGDADRALKQFAYSLSIRVT
jgi:cytochrome c-type biogenesis protein CcmH/NrfG